MNVALVYDRVNKWGGAERVLLALQELFPKATLFTSVYHPEKAAWAKSFIIKPSFLQKFSHVVNHHELYPYLMPTAFESHTFDNYDLVISLTSESAKGIITKPHTKHICYCLTPTRYLWSGYDEYFKNSLLRVASKPVVSYLRKWDTYAASRPDSFIAISKEVKARIKKYYGRNAAVVYPPVTLISEKLDKTKHMGDYFLIVSRLSKFTMYKRIDLAIRACNALGLPLKIVGTGSWKKELEKMSGPTISFHGDVRDAELKHYYRNCRALIFPGAEDFGLTVVEAQSFGRPVIALGKGGAKETVLHGKTGFLFNEQTLESLIDALVQFEELDLKPEDCRAQSLKFGTDAFKEQFLKLVSVKN